MRAFARRIVLITVLCVPMACPKPVDAAEWRASPVFAKMHREVPECRMTSER